MTEKKSGPEQYRKNNLDKSSSPYLLQHAGNPVWWQEWSPDVLKYAVQENKPLLVSSGYSTCHWCHVMAAGAFTDTETAAWLNSHFVCIKVDREQRPDIDQFMMDFIQSQNGSGGWPLNVFLTPDARPFFALTYAPVSSGSGRISFLEIARQIHEYYEKYGTGVSPFNAAGEKPAAAIESQLVNGLASFYDDENGGFGSGQKFPPHSTLLFLLYQLSSEEDAVIRDICLGTLEAMRLRGLNDHLQGGIFRYCVDREWTIPHFEKMLYDQAMALWCYSLAFKVTGKKEYGKMAGKILVCLDECFDDNGLYITAFNADTDHEEGITYLWDYKELAGVLTREELKKIAEVYDISEEGNFEGKNHLVRRNDTPLDDIETKLLSIRNARKQPSCDGKILCGINALIAVAMIQASRFLDQPEPEEMAASIIQNLSGRFRDGSTLGHSSFNGVIQKQSFLFDAGAMLLAVTMLVETDESWSDLMVSMSQYVESFRKDEKWIESDVEDFLPMVASWFDHPVPSSVSLAETGLMRAAILSGKEYSPVDFRQPYISDFYNINALISKGKFHVFTSEKPIPWKLLPANSIQKRGNPETHCFKEVCRVLNPEKPEIPFEYFS